MVIRVTCTVKRFLLLWVLDKRDHYIVHILFLSDIITICMGFKGLYYNNVCSGSMDSSQLTFHLLLTTNFEFIHQSLEVGIVPSELILKISHGTKGFKFIVFKEQFLVQWHQRDFIV